MFSRIVKSRIAEAQQDTPIVLLTGPRQAGKTTLVRQIAMDQNLKYLTLDDELTLLSARRDPTDFIRSLDCAVIDEIQRAPQLLLALKKSVDEDRRPGRFLVTGSANLMTLPTVTDSLAGRMETLSLLPLSQSEMTFQDHNWVDHVFEGHILSQPNPVVGSGLIDNVLRGGYPEAVSRASEKRRSAWAQQYIDALIQRDVQDIAHIGKLDQLSRFLRALAHTAGQMCNYSKLGGQIGIDGKTASKYVGIFEKMFLLKRIDVWSKNHLNRVVKTPKLQFIDSGLLSTLVDVNKNRIEQDKTSFGNVLETFVYSELLKHAASSDHNYSIMYYRDADKVEVDFVLENAAGNLVGVEVKAAATIKERDLNGLRKFARLSGGQFAMGLLLYDGEDVLPLGDGIWAAPISSLWGQAD